MSGGAVPIALFYQPDVNVTLVQGSALVATGVSSVLAEDCYLHALDKDGASFVTPLYQTVPIFAYVLGYFILGETITLAQGSGSFIVIVGALALSFELGPRGLRFKKKRCRTDAGGVHLECDKWRHFQIDRRGEGFFGFAFLGFRRPSHRRFDPPGLRSKVSRRFPRLFKQQRIAAVGLIGLSKTLFSVSEAVTLYATLLAPVALVLLVIPSSHFSSLDSVSS